MDLSKDPKSISLSLSAAPGTSGSVLPNNLDDLLERVKLTDAATVDEVYTLKSTPGATSFFATNLIIPEGFAWKPFANDVFGAAGAPLTSDLAILLLLSEAQAGASSRVLPHQGQANNQVGIGSHGCVETKFLGSETADLIVFEYKGSITFAEETAIVTQPDAPAEGWMMVLGLLPNLSLVYLAFSSPNEVHSFIDQVRSALVQNPDAKWVDIGSPIWNEKLRSFVARPATSGSIIVHS